MSIYHVFFYPVAWILLYYCEPFKVSWGEVRNMGSTTMGSWAPEGDCCGSSRGIASCFFQEIRLHLTFKEWRRLLGDSQVTFNSIVPVCQFIIPTYPIPVTGSEDDLSQFHSPITLPYSWSVTNLVWSETSKLYYWETVRTRIINWLVLQITFIHLSRSRCKTQTR